MAEESTSQEFIEKDETRNYLIEEIKQNYLIRKKRANLNGFKSHCAMTYSSFFYYCMYLNFSFCFFSQQKREKKHDKITMPAKDKLNVIEVFISKVLTKSYFTYDEIVSVNNVLRE